MTVVIERQIKQLEFINLFYIEVNMEAIVGHSVPFLTCQMFT